MATSGSVNFNDTRNTIISDALALIGVVAAEDSAPAAADVDIATRFLNRMIKHWQSQGVHLWAKTTCELPLEKNQYLYSLGSASTDAKCSNTVVETALSSAGASSATSLSVDSTTGMTVGDYIGIELDSGSLHWTTIATIPGSTSLTINSGLASAAAVDNVVYTFTTRINRPLRIQNIFVRDSSSNDRSLFKISKDEYDMISTKATYSTPSQYYYDPQLTSGKLYIWPGSSDVTERLFITYERPLEDFDAAADSPDLPQEWLRAIVYSLAVDIAPVFGKEAKLTVLLPMAQQFLQDVKDFDQENSSVYFGVRS